MKGIKRWFTSFGTWIGGILLAIVLLPKEISDWVVIGFTAFWLLVKCSGPVWRRIKKGWNWLTSFAAAYEAKEVYNNELEELKENLEELKLQVQQDNRETAFEGSTMIDRQLSAKITEKLQTLYPEASWSWISEERPSVLANDCAAGSIKIADTEEYNQAEVKFLPNGQIDLRMMAVKDFEQLKLSKNQKELTLDEWYTYKAITMLRNVIDELFSRGIKTLHLTDQGEMLGTMEKKSYGQLPNMPGLNDWPRLIELMAEDDIKATQEKNGLILSWG